MKPSTASPPLSKSSREKLVRRVISPAIRGQNCPICLGSLEPRSAAVLEACKHAYCLRCIRRWSTLRRKCPLCNSIFDSWFDDISLSSRSFHREILPPLNSNASTARPRSFRVHGANQRHVVNERRRSRPLPWRRSFGRPGSVAADVIAERKLHWRASVYDRRLQAVASAPGNRVRECVPVNDVVKERVLQRVEPWIRRELQVLLGEGDPSVVVRVAASLFVASLEKKDCVSSGQHDVVDDGFLEPLRPFLLDQTFMFWHELRCFAESPFNMETYDAVAEYRRLN
ncbi:uncharacterized protein LOC126792253 [Argentina anserina]|uniref:uncharacterized protein LOC126792253 n=1 Tax=Argentina anserina TaxID=57926 RepID=UPI0021765F45|nr:uncharacterized protein LOC126792253 [Potentilla anserina]